MKKIFYFLLSIIIIFSVVLVFNITPDIPLAELKAKYANNASKYINVQGMEVHYRDEGQGVPIVLLHGTAASLHTWDDWTKELIKDYRVIRMDLPAYGLTGPHPKNDYSMESYASFLHDFLDQLQVDTCILGGNSFGGKLTWYYTAEYPQQIKGMILVDPSGYPSDKSVPLVFKIGRTPILNQILRYVTPRSFIEKNLKEVYAQDDRTTPALVDRYQDMTRRPGNREAFIARTKTSYVDYTSKIPQIKAPTLLIWGQEDEWTTVGDTSHYLRDLPHLVLHVMKNTGHVPMEERPAESLVYVREFINVVGL